MVIGQYCGTLGTFPSNLPNANKIKSKGKEIFLRFKTDSSVTDKGFRISYKEVCKFLILMWDHFIWTGHQILKLLSNFEMFIYFFCWIKKKDKLLCKFWSHSITDRKCIMKTFFFRFVETFLSTLQSILRHLYFHL